MKKIKTIFTKITLSILTVLLLTIGSFNVKSYKKDIYAAELNTTTNLLGIIGTYYLQNLGMQLSSASSIGNQFINYITNVLGLATSSVLAYFQVKKETGKTEIDISNAGVSLLNSFKNWIIENGTTNIYTYGNAYNNFLTNRYLRNSNDSNFYQNSLSINLSNINMTLTEIKPAGYSYALIGYSSPIINSVNYPTIYNNLSNIYNNEIRFTYSNYKATNNNTSIVYYKFNNDNYFGYNIRNGEIYSTTIKINGTSSTNLNSRSGTNLMRHYKNSTTEYSFTDNEEYFNENYRFCFCLYNNVVYLTSIQKSIDSNNNDNYHLELLNTSHNLTLNNFNTEYNTINYENINNNNVVNDNLNNSEEIYRLTIQNTENIENIEELITYINQSISNLQSIISSNVVSIESGATDEEIENSNWFRTIVSALDNFFSTPISWIGDLFDSLKSHMTSGWNSLVSGIKDIFDVDVDDSIATELTETIEDSETAEGYLTDVFENTIEDIDLTPVTTFGTKFSNSTNWVKEQYENLTENSPYGTLVTYSLSIGFILLLIGRGIF